MYIPGLNRVARFLMDQEEGNLGNELEVRPLPIGQVGIGTEQRVIEFNGDSKFGAVMTIAIAAYWKSAPSAIIANARGLGGPIVATIAYGNGGTETQIEVDVPFGSAQSFGVAPTRQPNLEDCVILSLPASSVRIIPRNYGSYIPLDAADSPACGSDLRLDGLSVPTYPAGVDGSTFGVKAFVVKGTRASIGGPHRLFPLVNFSAPSPFTPTLFRVPAGAKNVRFYRWPMTGLFTYEWLAGFGPAGPLDMGTIAGGATSPIIPVPAQGNVLIAYVSPDPVNYAFADYELEA